MSTDAAKESAAVPMRRRFAAIVALVTSLVLVLYVLAVLLGHGADLLFGLVGVSVAIAGGWWLLTERMPRRLFGIIGVVVGLVALGASIARAVDGADRIVIRIVILVALFAVTFACARAAMVHDLDRLEVRVRAGGPPRHSVLLCNPKSGGGKVEKFRLVELASELGVQTPT